MVFLVLSLPLINGRRETTWERLQEQTSGVSDNHKLDVPDLRVGTLDTLMALSDDLVRLNNVIDGVVGKLKRQVVEVGGLSASTLKVDGQSVESYVNRFKWESAKYPAGRPLKETVDAIAEQVGRQEDELKVKVSEYNNIKSQLSSASRKASGTLAVREISSLVSASDVIDTENLTSIFVIISKFAVKDWLASYESLTEWIVPRSSKVVCEDNDYMLVSIVLFKRVVSEFKTKAREKSYQVREYSSNASDTGLSEEQLATLKKDVDVKKSELESWCQTAYGECFSCWMHISVIRLFVESVLRYGLPPQFQAVVAKPSEKSEPKLRRVLQNLFGGEKASMWAEDASAAPVGLIGEEMFPYVSFTLNIEH